MPDPRIVKIRNPIDGPGWTSAKKATKYLKRGQARLVGANEIEFIALDHRTLSAGRTMLTPQPAQAISPAHGPALAVVPRPSDGSSLRTFAPYPMRWEGYQKAA
jgi:hypothetical protein